MAFKKLVGLDIGSSNLRAVEATFKDDVIEEITVVASVPLTSQVIKNGSLESYDSFLVAVKSLFADNNIKTKDVVVAINGQSVLTRLVPGLQNEKNDEIFDKTLPYKMSEVIPTGVGNYYLGAHTIDEYIDNRGKKPQILRDCLVVGIEKINLDPIIHALEEAGLRVHGVDIAPLAIIRSILRTPEALEKRYASIDIGGDITTIVVHKNGIPEYIRTINGIGGNIINQRIAEELGLKINKAESEKFKALGSQNQLAENSTSVFGGGAEGLEAGSAEADLAQAINIIVAQEATITIKQIRDTLTDAITFSDIIDSPIDEVVLSGGGSGINTMASRMENELGIPVVYNTPFNGIKLESNIMKRIEGGELRPYEYTAAFGLLFGGRY